MNATSTATVWSIQSELEGWLRRVLDAEGLPQVDDLSLTPPQRAEHGDWTTNVALCIAAQRAEVLAQDPESPLAQLTNPRAVAEYLVQALQRDMLTSVKKIEVAGPGFINFFVDESVTNTSVSLLAQGVWSQLIPQFGEQQLAIVEYSSPNIAKPFSIGHLRSTIIGDVIARLLTATGYDVRRDNHLGDWGTQFGKLMYAITTWGDETAIAQSPRPIKELVELYVRFHTEAEEHPELEDAGRAWFKRLEEGDSEACRLWQQCIEWSWKEFEAIYERLGVTFTENDGRGYGESFFEDKMDVVIDELQSKNLLTESEGAQLVFFPNDELPPLMILQRSGSTLYATRDLATDRWRLFEKYGRDALIINEVGAEQSLYFKQIFAIESMLGWTKPGQRVHVGHGLYRFQDRKMSTRKGNIIWLEDVLVEAEKRAFYLTSSKHQIDFETNTVVTLNTVKPQHTRKLSEISNNAEKIAIGAIKWNDLKRSAHLDITFDWDELLSMDGNSGPYMQYSYVRTVSLLQKAREALGAAPEFSLDDLAQFAWNDAEQALIRQLLHYPLAVEQAARQYAPHVVCTQLYQVAQAFNTFYAHSPVVQDDSVQMARVALVQATQQVLGHGLELLGIERIERM